jgi:hypothetical protein
MMWGLAPSTSPAFLKLPVHTKHAHQSDHCVYLSKVLSVAGLHVHCQLHNSLCPTARPIRLLQVVVTTWRPDPCQRHYHPAQCYLQLTSWPTIIRQCQNLYSAWWQTVSVSWAAASCEHCTAWQRCLFPKVCSAEWLQLVRPRWTLGPQSICSSVLQVVLSSLETRSLFIVPSVLPRVCLLLIRKRASDTANDGTQLCCSPSVGSLPFACIAWHPSIIILTVA